MAQTLDRPKIEGARIVTRRGLVARAANSIWVLPLILGFQGITAWALLQNTAFQDEALYVYAGRQIWQGWLGGPPQLVDYSYYFSGNPFVYPLIAGLLDMVGGLELVRLFSMFCLLTTTACGYYIAKKLFDRPSAIFAAIFFVCQGPVLFLTRLATYDPLCLCFLALGMAVAVSASQARRPWGTLGLGPLLVLAFGAKYAALLFIPEILLVLVLCTLLKHGWKSMFVRSVLAGLSLIGAVGLAVLWMLRYDPTFLHALSATTTNREVDTFYPRAFLVNDVVTLVGLSYVLGLVGLVLTRKKMLLVALVFFGTSLLVPAYHIYKQEFISLDKHLGFSMFFLMPVAGWALSSLAGFRRTPLLGRYWVAAMGLCLILFQIGAGEGRMLYSRWPATNNLTSVMQAQVRSGAGHYLAEDVEVCTYYLEGLTYVWQWSGPYFFEYTDKQGVFYQDTQAYIHAIHDGYFDLIEYSYGPASFRDPMFAQAIQESNKYVLVTKIPETDSYGSSYFWVWRRK